MSLKFKKSCRIFADRLADWLSQQFPRFFYRHLYRRHLLERHRYFDVTSLITRGDPLESERIFVPLHLNPKSIHKISSGIVQDEPAQDSDEETDSKRQEIWHHLSAKDPPFNHLAIIAGPGFGKSTLMRHVALTIIAPKKKVRPLGVSYRLPALLFLREHAVFMRSNSADIPKPVTESIPTHLYTHLREVLVTCGPFASNDELKAIFVERRINPWRHQAPETNTRESRVDALIDLLHNQYQSDTGENALVLFLQVLVERTNPQTACHDKLAWLAQDIAQELVQQQQAVQSETAFNPDYTLLDALERDLKRYKGPPIPRQWFGKQLQKGNCLILLDGLDEIPNPLTRKQAAAWIEAQIIAHPQNHFILSSRPTSYQHAQFSRFHVLEVMSFNHQQIEEFVNNWYFAHELKGTTRVTPAIEKEAQEKAAHFLGNVLKNDRLFKLATNPLLLTMMIYVHYYRGILPKGRTDLFYEVIQVLFSKREGYLQHITIDQKQKALQPLAYEMMQQRVQNILTKDASQIVKAPLNTFGVRTSGAAFLQAVESSAGLLREEDNRSYRFAHLTFQEYLTAVYAKENHLEQTLVDHIADEWWHETIRLYCAQTDATRIIRACLADGRLSDLTFQLALNCLEETPTVSEKTKIRLETVIKRCLADPKLTPIVANAFAENRKSRMVCISVNKFIDPRLISHAEYQVFLHDQQQKGEYHQPDHWLNTSFPNNLAHDPIVGIRPEDAQAFCDWLTEREGKGVWRFRLPKLTELEGKGLFGLEIEGSANYWVWTRGKHECLGAIQPVGLASNIAQKKLLQDTRNDFQYEVKEIFPSGKQKLNLSEVKQNLAAFDFSQSQSRNLVQSIRFYAQSMQPEVAVIERLLEPFAQLFNQEELRYKDAYRQTAIEITDLNTQIEQQKAQLTVVHSEISANYSAPYQQIEQYIRKYEGDLNQQKSQHQQIREREKAALDDVENQFNHHLSVIQKQMTDIKADAALENQRIKSHYQAQYAILDEDTRKFRAEIAKSEGMRGQYTDDSINQVKRQYEDVLSNIEANRRGLNAHEQTVYRDIAAQLSTALSRLESQQNDIQQQVRQVQEQIKAATKGNYAIIDQNIKTIESDLDRLKQEDKHLRQQEQQEKDRASAQANENIANIRAYINKLSQQQQEYHSKGQLFYQKAKTVRMSSIVIPQKLRSILDALKTLDAFFANYFECEPHATGQLNTNLEEIAAHMKKLVALSQEHAYIESSPQLSTTSYIQRLGHNPPQTFRSPLATENLHEFLQRLVNNTQKAIEVAAALDQIIHNIASLKKWMTSAHNNFQALTMDNLSIPLPLNIDDQKLYASLERAYNYLRYRHRETIYKDQKSVIDHRLHYTRLCILAVVSNHLTQHAANTNTEQMNQYIQLYVALQILGARMQGEAQAFEGLRLIKERIIKTA